MKILALICRILLGLAFVVFGANIMHPFMPAPAQHPGTPVGDWSLAMMQSGYMLHVGFFQFLGGLLVLFGGTVPLGLCILCPVTVNILIFHHTFTGNHGIIPGLVTALFELILIYAYRRSFAGIMSYREKPVD